MCSVTRMAVVCSSTHECIWNDRTIIGVTFACVFLMRCIFISRPLHLPQKQFVTIFLSVGAETSISKHAYFLSRSMMDLWCGMILSVVICYCCCCCYYYYYYRHHQYQ
jgi:hypothetical protein